MDAISSYLLLVVRPGAPGSVLVATSKALVTRSDVTRNKDVFVIRVAIIGDQKNILFHSAQECPHILLNTKPLDVLFQST